MILGLGIDLIASERLGRALERHGERLLRRCFTAREVAECQASAGPKDAGERAWSHRMRIDSLAARFAAKEAAMKALGTGWTGGVCWTDLEVTLDAHGAPQMVLHGFARGLAHQRGVRAVFVSLTHDGGHAAAVVLLWGDAGAIATAP